MLSLEVSKEKSRHFGTIIRDHSQNRNLTDTDAMISSFPIVRYFLPAHKR